MRVLYNNGRRFKWVATQQVGHVLRASLRPRPPEAHLGKLLKATHAADGTHWSELHVEVIKGYLVWWRTRGEAMRGKRAMGSLYLLGLQPKTRGVCLQVRAERSPGIYAFKAQTEEQLAEWVAALWEHAGYCVE